MRERAEHTAGPWKHVYDRGNVAKTCIEEDGVIIAQARGSNAVDRARLIAAAPDLLAACHEFVRKVECGEAKSTRSYEQMKAAISKATGEA